jgi:hypothetical protein
MSIINLTAVYSYYFSFTYYFMGKAYRFCC